MFGLQTFVVKNHSSDFDPKQTYVFVDRAKTINFNPPIENATYFKFDSPQTITSADSSKDSKAFLEIWNGSTRVGGKYLYGEKRALSTIDSTYYLSPRPTTITSITITGHANRDGSIISIISINQSTTFSFTVEIFPLLVNVRSINALATVDLDFVGDNDLRLTYEGPDGAEVDVKTDSLQSVYNVSNLMSETLYVFRLYVDAVLTETISETTLEDLPSNYVVTDFFDGKQFQIQNLSRETRKKMSQKLNAVFNTGDIMKLKKDNRDLIAKFVKRGDTIKTEGSDLLVPFLETDGSGQSFNLEVDGTTVMVGYNETSNTVVVDSVEYGIGDTLLLDGKKCTITEYEE